MAQSPGRTERFRVPYKWFDFQLPTWIDEETRVRYTLQRARYIGAVSYIRRVLPNLDEVERSVRRESIDAVNNGVSPGEMYATIWEPFNTTDKKVRRLGLKIKYFSDKICDMRKPAGDITRCIQEQRRDEANEALSQYTTRLGRLADLIIEYNGLVTELLEMGSMPLETENGDDDGSEDVEDGWILASGFWSDEED